MGEVELASTHVSIGYFIHVYMFIYSVCVCASEYPNTFTNLVIGAQMQLVRTCFCVSKQQRKKIRALEILVSWFCVCGSVDQM